MHIVVAGGSGLLGRALIERLGRDHQIVVLTRRPGGTVASGARQVAWTPDGSVGAWVREIDAADVVVNLAGAGLADRRWTAARKAVLRSSRIDSTRTLIAGLLAASARARVFVQGSAVGYYGASQSGAVHDEASPAGDDFLSDLAAGWEEAAAPAVAAGCRLVVVRTGVVLSADGGALPPMARPFRWFVGGRVGSGRQYMSWISIDDWVDLVAWAIGTPEVHGALNGCTPYPVTNAAFSAALARVLHRPNLLPVPAVVLRALFGEMADTVLLCGQRVVPAKALAFGFRFAHTDIDETLAHVLRAR